MSKAKTAKTGEDVMSDATEAVQETLSKATKGFESMVALNREAIEALVESAGVTAKGAEKVQASFAAYAKTSAEAFSAAAKAVMGASSWQVAAELQSTYAKSALESYVAEAGRIRDIVVATTQEAFEPLRKHGQAVAEQMRVAA